MWNFQIKISCNIVVYQTNNMDNLIFAVSNWAKFNKTIVFYSALIYDICKLNLSYGGIIYG